MTSACIARLCWLATFLVVCVHATTFSHCDIRQNGVINVADVQLVINEALGLSSPLNDLNGDGAVNVTDVQIEINAALGLGCLADPALVSILPNIGPQGAANLNVTIAGRLTGFTNQSVVNLGAGITVTNIAATNATTLTATLAIASSAATTARTLTVDGFTLPNAFTVTPPISVAYSYDTQGRLVTATYTTPSGAVKVVTYSYDAAGNRTVVVAQ